MDQYPQQQQPDFPPTIPSVPPATYPPTQPGYAPQPGDPQQPGYSPQPEYPQPGFAPYPDQPNPGQPGYIQAQPPRKSNAKLWVILAVIALCVIIGGGAGIYAIIQGQSSPTATMQKFCVGYTTLNAQEVYDTLSKNMQSQSDNSEATIQQSFDQLKSSHAKVNSCTVSNVQQNGSKATGTIKLTITSSSESLSLPVSAAVTLVDENGTWKINTLT